MADGSIRISTKLDNSNIDKDIVQLENKIKKLQINNKKKNHEQDSLQAEINEYNELLVKADEYRNKIEQLNAEKKQMLKDNPALAVSVDTPEYANIKNQIEEIKQKYQEATIEIDKQSPKIEKSRIKLEEVKAQQEENNSKIAEYNRKLEEAKNKQQEVNYSTKGISKELNTGIKKILRYGAALISIRSIYGLLSSAANSWLSGNNSAAKQLKSDIDYMKNAIGHALSPVIKYIVDLLYQALGFTGALIKAFTGIDIFAGSVADYMSKTTSSASKTNKELKKQLLNFDRINKLNDNSSNSSGGGVGTIAPSQDLSNIMNKYSEQAERIKQIFEDIKDYVLSIGAGILAWKVSSGILSFLTSLGAISKSQAMRIGLGISLIITGAILYYQGAKKVLEGSLDPADLLKALAGSALVGIGTALVFSNPIGLTLGLALGLIIFSVYMWNKNEDITKKIAGAMNVDYDGKDFMQQMIFKMHLGLQILGLERASSLVVMKLKLAIAEQLQNIPIVGSFLADNIKKSVVQDYREYVNSGNKVGQGIAAGVKQGQTSQKKTLSTNLSSIIRTAISAVNTSGAKNIGANIISGIRTGMNNNKSTLSGTIASIGTLILNKFKTKLGIHSPSREMASLAKFIPLGIAEGIDSTQDKALGSMKNLVYGLEDTMSDVDYSPLTEIPKIPRNAVTYVPKQSISTNEIQRSIVGQDSSVINKLLSNLQTGSNKNTTVTIPLIIDGEEFVRKVIELNGNYNLATNGGGL